MAVCRQVKKTSDSRRAPQTARKGAFLSAHGGLETGAPRIADCRASVSDAKSIGVSQNGAAGTRGTWTGSPPGRESESERVKRPAKVAMPAPTKASGPMLARY